ncbi:uncharacterized protein LOC142992990 isoform X2 [Genypterus blacodes]|uniref:uncharacterized protein LOC142992990 isoform X2 n=1 Tax=Genypterus blacodes TaxID=154954 RepID=UPI003F76644B
MSAPPLAGPPAMPTMVSRLPKFGPRPRCNTSPGGDHSGSAAGVNTAASASTRLTNGFYHHPGPTGVKAGLTGPSSAVQNGFIRVPTSFSMKWKKGSGGTDEGGAETEGQAGKGRPIEQNHLGNHLHQYYLPQQQVSSQRSTLVTHREAEKPNTTSAGKGPGFGLAVTPSALPLHSPKTLPVSKTGLHSTKLSQTTTGLTNGTKQSLTGPAGSKRPNGISSSLRRPQTSSLPSGSRPGSGPGSRSGSPLDKKPQASRSHSSDSIGSGPSGGLTENDLVRSRSLTQVQRQASPTSTSTVKRSYSFNRPSDRGLKDLSPSSSTARGGNVAKLPLTRQEATKGTRGGLRDNGGVKVQSSGAPGRPGVSSSSLLPPTVLKKSLLPNHGSISKPSGISYKLSRPSLIKQPRPLRVTTASDLEITRELNRRRNSLEMPSSTANSPEAPLTESADAVSLGDVSIVGETLEDMSLSSTSSLDRNDTSQEYMDDFDNLGNGGVGILLLSSKNDEDDSGLDQSCPRFDDSKVVNGIAKATGLCSFLEDTLDWDSMRLSGDQGDHQLPRLSRGTGPSQLDYHDQGGSSLDLSPADSCGSGGTYMWDEEGLEPLGGATTTVSINTNSTNTHHIGSFDSDLNSVDILNNLDSCDLDDDDLMLDVDLPEDTSLHSDVDGLSHMAQWRRRQICWGTQDIHSDNSGFMLDPLSDIHCYQLTQDIGNKRTDQTQTRDFILDLCSPSSPILSTGPGLGLDVEELAEDCSAVKSQLEYLQRLLLQEEDADDDTLTTDTLSPEMLDSSQSSDSQVQVLLQEVQQLREELRSRDRTIAQLTQKLVCSVPTVPTRCRCQETKRRADRHTQTSVMESVSVASQTPWRENTPPILHSPSRKYQKPLTALVSASPLANSAPDDMRTRADPPPRPQDCHDTKPEGDDARRRAKVEERRRTRCRSFQLLLPTKPRLFQSQISSSNQAHPQAPDPASSTTTAVTHPVTTRHPSEPHKAESNAIPGFKSPSSVCLSRLPKPKSQ